MADNNNDSLIKWARTFVTKDIEKLIYEQPKLELNYKTEYWFAVIIILQEDIKPVLDLVHNYIKSIKISKDQSFNIKDLPIKVEDMPFVDIANFYQILRRLDYSEQSKVIEAIDGITWSTQKRLLQSLNEDKYNEFYTIINKNNIRFGDSVKYAQFLDIKDNILGTADYDTMNNVDINSPLLESYMNEKFPHTDFIENRKPQELTIEEATEHLNYVMFGATCAKGTFDKYLSILPEELKTIALKRIPKRTLELLEKIEIPDDFNEIYTRAHMGNKTQFALKLRDQIIGIPNNKVEIEYSVDVDWIVLEQVLNECGLQSTFTQLKDIITKLKMSDKTRPTDYRNLSKVIYECKDFKRVRFAESRNPTIEEFRKKFKFTAGKFIEWYYFFCESICHEVPNPRLVNKTNLSQKQKNKIKEYEKTFLPKKVVK